jgi:hypothetical protein
MQVDRKRKQTKRECATCLGVHNEAIHDATVNIHQWFRDQIAYQTMMTDLGEDVSQQTPHC